MKNRLKQFYLLLTLLPLGLNAQINLNNGLIAHYSFEKSDASDGTKNGYDGSIFGTKSIVTGTCGRNAIEFDGSNYIQINNTTDLNLGTKSDWTVSLWFQFGSNPQGVQPLISKMEAGGGSDKADYYIFWQNKKIYWGTGRSTDTTAWMSFAAPNNLSSSWNHLVVTLEKLPINGTSYRKRIYINGNLLKSGITTVKNAEQTTDLFLGYSHDGNGKNYLNGKIDDVRIYNRALNLFEAKTLANCGNYASFTFAKDKDLTAYYPFNNNLKDSTSNGFDGIGVSNPNYGIGCGSALLLNGTSNYVNVADDNKLDVGKSKSITVTGRFYENTRTSPSNKVNPIVTKMVEGAGSNQSDYYVFTQNGFLYWGTGQSIDSISWLETEMVDMGKWHSFVAGYELFNYNGNPYQEKYLVIDSQLTVFGNSVAKADANTTDLFIGYSHDGNGKNYFDGMIDEVRLYNRALNPKEALEINRCSYVTSIQNDISLTDFNIIKTNQEIKVNSNNIINTLLIVNMEGKIISVNNLNQSSFNFDLSNLKAGIYMLKLSDNKGNFVSEKFVKM